jgi:hypothetical protein
MQFTINQKGEIELSGLGQADWLALRQFAVTYKQTAKGLLFVLGSVAVSNIFLQQYHDLPLQELPSSLTLQNEEAVFVGVFLAGLPNVHYATIGRQLMHYLRSNTAKEGKQTEENGL